LDEKDFRYIGPRPQSRETALVMLADGCEARVRAKRPPNETELRAIIKETIDTCLAAGQLEDTPLTLKDLSTIMDSFAATLKGIYHPRVEYPNLDIPTQPTAAQEEGEEGRSSLGSISADTLPTPHNAGSFSQPTIKAPLEAEQASNKDRAPSS
jgi:hypothetical protein